MSLIGGWLLNETTGNSLADGSTNSYTGTTNGTTSGEQGVLLTGPQTISLPLQLSAEASIGIFMFIKASSPLTEQTVLSNSSGTASDSIIMGINASGIPYVTHLGNTVMGVGQIDTSEVHIGYVYDEGYNIQYMYVNGSIVSTKYGASVSSNNSNTLTLGSTFAGYIRDVNVYSGIVSSSVPEGLSGGRDPSLILPSGTIYASRVEESGDIVHGGTIFKNEYMVSTTFKANKAHFVHDTTIDEVYQTSSIQHESDATGANSGSIKLRVKESDKMNTHVDVRPGETRVGNGESVATVDVTGLRFNSDSAGLYFGENQEFRIVMTSDTPPRLRYQNYDSSTGEYVTKYSVLNR